MKTRVLLMGLAVLSLLVAGCTQTKVISPSASNNGGESKAGKIVDMTIAAYNYGFTQSEAAINKGDTVRIKFTSTGGRHGISIPEFGVSSGPASEGEEKIIVFVADKSGNFEYFCNVPRGPGHSTMRGTIVIV